MNATFHLIISVIILIIIAILSSSYTIHEKFRIVKDNQFYRDELVIVSSHHSEDLHWLDSVEDVPVVVCSKTLDSPACAVAENRGREATSYLKFIIDNYHQLPKHVAFIHGHENAWHQNGNGNLLHVIKNCAKYKEYGFISLNNTHIDDRNIATNNTMQYLRYGLWKSLFLPYLHRDAPDYLFHDCCAQFIVSKERILLRPKAAYQHWYTYIMYEDPNDDGGLEIGAVFEYIWHVIFGEPDFVTIDEHHKMFHKHCS